MSVYEPRAIELQWREVWRKYQTFATDVNDKSKPKWYNLVMFPYPSGDLHIGHWYNFGPADVLARYKRMHGFNVLNPFGFDAFGLPAENAAIKRNIHPADWTKQNISNMISQLETMGASYDWDRIVNTSDPNYYKWTQWCFIQLFKKGLAYKKEAAANWCPSCKSVLANEQAEGGVCWRCGTQVEQRMINQWFFKITDYADELQSAVDALDWPEKIKLMQKNWIGKSEGTIIRFAIADQNKDLPQEQDLEVFSTRPDTIMGATFLVIAPEHPLVPQLTTIGQKREIERYQEVTKKKSEFERIAQKEKKTGAFTGTYALHPITNEYLPIWISDFVLPNYAKGAIMGVPAHDERDYDFAKTHELLIKYIAMPNQVTSLVVNNSVDPEIFTQLTALGHYLLRPFSTWGTLISFESDRYPEYEKYAQRYLHTGPWFLFTDGKVRNAIFKDAVIPADPDGTWTAAKQHGRAIKIIDSSLDFSFPEEGFAGPFTVKEGAFLVNSGTFSGLPVNEAIKTITGHLVKLSRAETTTQYRLRDWLISRQRYWGPPVPMLYCEQCGTLPVPESQLPVILPYDVDYTPNESSPLGSSAEFVHTTCPQCNGPATRDTDTMDTFVDSSWYFLRYLSPQDDQHPFPLGQGDTLSNHWLPVDKYIGGAEHAVLHLLYARFFVKVFRDLGYINFDEPFQSLFNQGTILGPDHQKMSKSKGNVIAPDELVMHYGADTVRVYLCFLGPYDQGGPWNPSGIEGASRFVRKLFTLLTNESLSEASTHVESAMHKLIKKVTQDIPAMKFNTAIAAFMEFVNTAQEIGLTMDQKKIVAKLIAPFCPFLAEEVWHTVFNKPEASSIHLEDWPTYDPSLLIEHEVEVVVQVNSKVRGHMMVPRESLQEHVQHAALELEKVQTHLQGKEINKVIFVPQKIINFITSWKIAESVQQ